MSEKNILPDNVELSNLVIKKTQEAFTQIKKEDLSGYRKRGIYKFSLIKAAALICILLGTASITAVASRGIPETIKKFYQLDSAKKIETASKMGETIISSDESNGYVLTVEGYLEDEEEISLLMNLHKKDGTSIKTKNLSDIGFEKEQLFDEKPKLLSTGGGTEFVMEETTDTNLKFLHTFKISHDLQANIQLKVSNVLLYYGENCEQIAGDWKFDIPLDAEACGIELGKGNKLEIDGTTGILDRCRISPIGFTIAFSSEGDLSHKLIQNVDCYTKLYLKNGEIIDLIGGGGPLINEDNTWTFLLYGTFDKLIPLEDMEKIVIANEEIKIN